MLPKAALWFHSERNRGESSRALPGLPARHTWACAASSVSGRVKLDRDERLVERELADVRETRRYLLTQEERQAVEAEARFLASLLERIEAERLTHA